MAELNVPSESTDLMQLLPFALAFVSGATGDELRVDQLKSKLRAWAKDDPMDAVLATIIGGGIAFYLVEKDTHPELEGPWDGILYMTTLSIGSTPSLSATTQAGRALTTFVQTFGLTLALGAFDPPAAEQRAAAEQEAAVQVAILERLDRIVQLLEKQPA